MKFEVWNVGSDLECGEWSGEGMGSRWRRKGRALGSFGWVLRFGRVLLVRRIRGWVGAEPIRPRAAPGLPGRLHEAAAKLLYAVFLWRSNAFPNGCFLFAAFAAGLVRNPYDPGLLRAYPAGYTRPQLSCSMRCFFGEVMRSRTGASYSPHSRLGWCGIHTTPGCHPGLHEAAASQLYKDSP